MFTRKKAARIRRRGWNHQRSQRALMLEALEHRQLLAADGTLDNSFSDNGYNNLNIASTDQGEAVVVQTDGKIIVAGQGNGLGDFVMARYLPNGKLDKSFGARKSGKVTTNFGGTDGARDVILDAQGRIILVGGANGTFGVARYTPHGIPDTTFGDDGTVRISQSKLGGGKSEAYAVDIHRRGPHAGSIVVAGQGNNMNDMVLVRLTSSGRLDPTFDGDGVVVQNFVGTDGVRDVAIDDVSGLIVAVGFTDGMNEQAVAMFTDQGQLHTDFGDRGLHTERFGGSSIANGVTIRSGVGFNEFISILVVGQGNGMKDITMFQIDSLGNLEPQFGKSDQQAGVQLVDPGKLTMNLGGTNAAVDVAVQHDGKIVVVGDSRGVHVVAVRFLADGSVDRSFADDGVFQRGFGGHARARSVAIQRDGKIVIAGDGSAHQELLVARLNVSPPAGENYDEYDDSMDYAIPLAIGQQVIRTVADGFDEDWFSFRLNAASHLTLTATIDANSVELTALLYRDYVDIWSAGAYVPGGTMKMEFDLAPGVYQLGRQPCDPGTTFTLDIGATSRGAELWQNPELPEDVNQDGQVAPLDALMVINRVGETGPLPVLRSHDDVLSVDVDGNNYLAPLDALLVINRLGQPAAAKVAANNQTVVTTSTFAVTRDSALETRATMAPWVSAADGSDPPFTDGLPLDSAVAWNPETQWTRPLVVSKPGVNALSADLVDELADELFGEIGDNWSA